MTEDGESGKVEGISIQVWVYSHLNPSLHVCHRSMFSYITERPCECSGQASFVVPLVNSREEGSQAFSVFLPVQRQLRCKQGWSSEHQSLRYWSS